MSSSLYKKNLPQNDGVPAPPRDTSVPSRRSVSAAIALVRAKQQAASSKSSSKSTVQQVNNLDELKRLRESKQFGSSSAKLASHTKESRSVHQMQQKQSPSSTNTRTESENKKPSLQTDASSKTRAPFGLVTSQSRSTAEKKQNEEAAGGTLFAMVNDVFSSRSQATAPRANVSSSYYEEPSFDPFDQPTIVGGTNSKRLSSRMAQAAKTRKPEPKPKSPRRPDSPKSPRMPSSPAASAAIELSRTKSIIPDIPSLPSKGQESDDDDDDDDDLPEVDAKTIEDVNAFLDKLGVRAATSKDSSVADSIERMRMLSASLSAATSADESSVGEVQPETLAEISAFIDAVSKKGEISFTEEHFEVEQNDHFEEEAATGIFSDNESKKHLGDAPSSLPETKDEEVVVKQVRSDDSAEVSEQTRTSRPSPIYELLKEVPHGAHVDPPSTLLYDGSSIHREDPPGPPRDLPPL